MKQIPVQSEAALAGLIGAAPLRAAPFIVTVYGDVVEPRGGVLWIGTLIEVCAEVGINESLVRTAVSRLVTAGQLAGQRVGRRSYYRLTEAAREEFAAAAKLLFDPDPTPKGWLIAEPDAPPAAADLRRSAWAPLAGGMLIAPDRPDVPRWPGLVFRATAVAGADALPGFAESRWQVSEHADAYRAFLRVSAALSDALALSEIGEGRAPLMARLLLIHRYRLVLLRDPRLPVAALGPDWPGEAARHLFVELYCRLSPVAEAAIGQWFEGAHGPLEQETEASRRRLAALSRQ